MATRKRAGLATSSSVPDNGGDHSGGGGSAGVAIDDVFSTYVYTGSSSGRNILNGIDLAGEGGMVWIKNRSSAANHQIADSENNMGTGNYTFLISNNTQASQYTASSGVQEFLSNGFGLSGGATTVNGAGQEYVSWTFRKAPNFFDVVKYTGDGIPNHEIPHNLGVVPGMIITKRTNGSGEWIVWHRGDGVSSINTIWLNKTDAANNGMKPIKDVTDKSFKLDNYSNSLYKNNADGDEYIAYVFAHDDSDESMIKCGSFPGRYSTIDLGFEPQWVLMKPANSDGPWTMLDTMRGWTAQESVGSSPLRANENSAEIQGDTSLGYITSTGFYVGNVGTANHIYMAIRRPTKHASEFEPEELFDVGVGDGVDPDPSMRTPMVVDAGIITQLDRTSQNTISSRITGTSVLWTDATSAENTQADMRWDYQNGFWVGNSAYHSFNYWAWRRAPGFFDVVAYTGNGTGQDIPHNLGVAPEMMWIKRRNYDYRWTVYYPEATNQGTLELNTDAARGLNPTTWDNTAPTATHFTVGTDVSVNHTHPYIAYLFASVAGISKVGSYTGTASDIDIDCGFTTGARFLLIKRTDDTGSWLLFDALRGIVLNGFDPYVELDKASFSVVNNKLLNPYPSGFTVLGNGGGYPFINANGGKYIYYAIA